MRRADNQLDRPRAKTAPTHTPLKSDVFPTIRPSDPEKEAQVFEIRPLYDPVRQTNVPRKMWKNGNVFRAIRNELQKNLMLRGEANRHVAMSEFTYDGLAHAKEVRNRHQDALAADKRVFRRKAPPDSMAEYCDKGRELKVFLGGMQNSFDVAFKPVVSQRDETPGRPPKHESLVKDRIEAADLALHAQDYDPRERWPEANHEHGTTTAKRSHRARGMQHEMGAFTTQGARGGVREGDSVQFKPHPQLPFRPGHVTRAGKHFKFHIEQWPTGEKHSFVHVRDIGSPIAATGTQTARQTARPVLWAKEQGESRRARAAEREERSATDREAEQTARELDDFERTFAEHDVDTRRCGSATYR
jgi:hypothetical protein